MVYILFTIFCSEKLGSSNIYIKQLKLTISIVLYRYGGIYLDSDVIVLKSLSSVQNSIGMLGQIEGNSTFSGAVMAFEKNRY